MESSNFNYYKQPFLVKLGLFISLTGLILHTEGFKAAIKHIRYCIDIHVFRFMYKRSESFRKRTIKKIRANGSDPFTVFLVVNMLLGYLFNVEKITSDEYIELYIKLNELPIEEADELKHSIANFKDKIKHTDNEV